MRVFANCQSITMFCARSTTVALVSVASSQTLRLRCFQMLQITVVRHCESSTDKFSSNEKIAAVDKALVEITC